MPQAESLVGQFREQHDPSAAAGMPAHITLLYPFSLPGEIGEKEIEKLRQCFTRFEAFDFFLSAMRRFSTEVLYLAPEPDEPFRELTLAIWHRFPETPPYGAEIFEHRFSPNGCRLADERQVDCIANQFARASQGKLPIRATAIGIALMDTLAASWQVRATFTLR